MTFEYMEHIREVKENEFHPSNMKRGFFPEQVMETSLANPEKIKEGPFLYGKVTYSSQFQYRRISPQGPSSLLLRPIHNQLFSGPTYNPLHNISRPIHYLILYSLLGGHLQGAISGVPPHHW
jgi:hypothetical protein